MLLLNNCSPSQSHASSHRRHRLVVILLWGPIINNTYQNFFTIIPANFFEVTINTTHQIQTIIPTTQYIVENFPKWALKCCILYIFAGVILLSNNGGNRSTIPQVTVTMEVQERLQGSGVHGGSIRRQHPLSARKKSFHHV